MSDAKVDLVNDQTATLDTMSDDHAAPRSGLVRVVPVLHDLMLDKAALTETELTMKEPESVGFEPRGDAFVAGFIALQVHEGTVLDGKKQGFLRVSHAVELDANVHHVYFVPPEHAGGVNTHHVRVSVEYQCRAKRPATLVPHKHTAKGTARDTVHWTGIRDLVGSDSVERPQGTDRGEASNRTPLEPLSRAVIPPGLLAREVKKRPAARDLEMLRGFLATEVTPVDVAGRSIRRTGSSHR